MAESAARPGEQAADSGEKARAMEMEARDLLTVEQAAQYLQVSQSSIRSYIRQGRLQAYRIAGKRKVLIPRSALLSLLEPARPEDVDAATAENDNDDDADDSGTSGSNAGGNPNRKRNSANA